MEPVPHSFTGGREEPVSALLLRPREARRLLVLAHGAGADMHHRSMVDTAAALAGAGTATFRYQFPFMERRSGPDPAPILVETARRAVAAAAALTPDLPLFAGGRSLGGRMTSQAAAGVPGTAPVAPGAGLPGVRGLIFFAFPLHPAGKPGCERAAHLCRVPVPMLFLQGTRDSLAQLELLRETVAGLDGRATLHLVDTADHSFKVLRSSGLRDEDVLPLLAARVDAWAAALDAGS